MQTFTFTQHINILYSFRFINTFTQGDSKAHSENYSDTRWPLITIMSPGPGSQDGILGASYVIDNSPGLEENMLMNPGLDKL